jgi:two-component system NtrC family sensor kinase
MIDLGTLLIVDDEKGIRDMLGHELGRRGYRIETAANGRLALECLRAGGIQLVVSDVKMPELDGQEMLIAIKRIDPGVEVILLTGFATIETAVAAMKQGAYDFLQKPFDVEELALLIGKALEKRQLKAVSAVYEASREIFRTKRMEDLLPRVAELLARVCRADNAGIALLEDGRVTLPVRVGAAPADGWDARLERMRLRIPADAEADPILDENAVTVPLVVGGESLGALCCSRANPADPFNNEDLRLMTVFAAQIALAVQNAQAFRRLDETHARLVQSEKVNAVGRLACGVAHEINNPLTSILGLAHLLAAQESLSVEQRNDVRTIIEQSERCRSITTDLLLFGRKQKIEEPIVLEQALKSAVRLSRLDIVSRRLSVTVHEPEACHPVLADSSRMQQVFLNLIANAAHAAQDKDDRRLDIRVESQGKLIGVRFSDNGCGIEPKNLSRVFEPFFTTKEAGCGTGLGLSICREIVQEYGGTITATSRPGLGSEFLVTLPALAAASASRLPSMAGLR